MVDLIFLIFFFLLGLAVGSFINMVEYRWSVRNGFLGKKKKISLWGGRSFCDQCKKQLSWQENMPVLGWLYLKGKSKCCGTPLPYQYPLVELLTGILFLLFWGVLITTPGDPLWVTPGVESLLGDFSWVVSGFVGLFILGLLVFVFLVDLKYRLILDEAVVGLVILAIVWGLLTNNFGWEKVISAGGVFLFFWFLFLVTKGKGMGFGDVKLVIFMGLLLGGWGTLAAVYIAFISGALVGIGLMIFRGYGRKSELPFGPFLILGTLLVWWSGSGAGNWMKSLLFGRMN
jgi:leader peptidase (prepilin peptidase) / N-methyltransferase